MGKRLCIWTAAVAWMNALTSPQTRSRAPLDGNHRRPATAPDAPSSLQMRSSVLPRQASEGNQERHIHQRELRGSFITGAFWIPVRATRGSAALSIHHGLDWVLPACRVWMADWWKHLVSLSRWLCVHTPSCTWRCSDWIKEQRLCFHCFTTQTDGVCGPQWRCWADGVWHTLVTRSF